MPEAELTLWMEQLAISARAAAGDAAHDFAHTERVVKSAVSLADAEGASLEVVLPAAWLHDCVTVPKDSPDRTRASVLAADRAIELLGRLDYPVEHFEAIRHAIAAHSFSAGIAPVTLEAKVVQDADRLDALGAIGIARCFCVGGALGRTIYHPEDPFCEQRDPDDTQFSVDHFFAKLFRLPETMWTRSAREEAGRRAAFMRCYLRQMGMETGKPVPW